MKKKILVIFGTRPEAIKLAPLIIELRKFPGAFDVRVCVTAQHREMLDQVLRFFEIVPDDDLNIMRPGQTLFDVTRDSLDGLKNIIGSYRPDWVVVQGDTTTVFTAALVSFYHRVKVAHVEAGLRSFNKFAPFPEEINRVLTSHLADLHFAPTERARKNLLQEGVPEDRVHVVGNTVIDALLHGVGKVKDLTPDQFGHAFKGLNGSVLSKRIILVTGHRRENFGKPFENICHALKELAQRENTAVIYPVHLNPNVRKPVFDILKGAVNVHLIEPLDYPAFIWLMEKSHLILTDSGGVQEEAPSLGKPVLVMREVTERTEGIDAGTAMLVGTDPAVITREAGALLDDPGRYASMADRKNPYGDGRSSHKIQEVLARQ
ncbi:MAG TPA: UDP-N-acetylglucosamine 2-epimerase (non-hydrolyzing) [Nitrospirota bacterium]